MQRSTHSSQIYTFGPAMSLLTSFRVFLQNEHLSILDRLFRTSDHMLSSDLTIKRAATDRDPSKPIQGQPPYPKKAYSARNITNL
jgi:hypothetical protein